MIFPIILAGQPRLSEEKLENSIKDQMMSGMTGSGPQILEELGLLQDDMPLAPPPFLTKKATSVMSSDRQSN